MKVTRIGALTDCILQAMHDSRFFLNQLIFTKWEKGYMNGKKHKDLFETIWYFLNGRIGLEKLYEWKETQRTYETTENVSTSVI